MAWSPLDPYVEPVVHEAISCIIRRHSTNPADVRHEALRGVDLSATSRLLDLGCGFGFMIDALAGSIRPDAEIVGVDMHLSNREAFLARAEAVAGSARFVCRMLDSQLDFPARSFGAVIASYSLYYFPRILPEVRRVMIPRGVFVSITHGSSHCRGLLEALGISFQQSQLHTLLGAFSAENGPSILSGHFRQVEQRPYPNALVFRTQDLDDFLALVRFKLPAILPAPITRPAEATRLVDRARKALIETGCVTIEKDDTVFVCRGPYEP